MTGRFAATFLAATVGAQALDVSYVPSENAFPNPERGFYQHTQWTSAPNLSGLRNEGVTLIYADLHLAEYRGRPITADRLSLFRENFARVRSEGLKAIPRITYSHSINEPDAPLEIAESHLEQLAPIFADNADIIAWFQAGIIGAWGEWHNSSNDLATEENRARVLGLLFQHLPAQSFIALRTPMFEYDYNNGATLDASLAFTNTPLARLAQHNDCFLASANDFGTYPSNSIEPWKDRVASRTPYTPLGGETCAVSDFTNCAFAIPEMEHLRWTYLNRGYNQDVLDALGPCLDQIERRLGYRLRLLSARFPDALMPGQTAPIELAIINDGFAPPYNERPVFIRLLSGPEIVAELPLAGADPRLWNGGETHLVSADLTIPEELSIHDSLTLALWMPDAGLRLRSDARYSVRFANEGIWNPEAGHNLLVEDLPVQLPAESTWTVQ